MDDRPTSAIAAAAIPLLHTLDLLSFPLLLAVVAVVGAARGPADSAKEVMVPEAAERAGVPLERATGLSGVTERLAFTLGPAVGGALVALLGPLAGLVVNAGCFALGSVVVAVALPRGTGHPYEDSEAHDGDEEPGYWRRFGEGFAFLRGEPLLLTVIVMLAVTNLLDMAFAAVLMPVWAKESGHGPSAIGLAGTVTGAAAVAGSLVAAVAAHRLRRRIVFFAGFLLAGAPRFLILGPMRRWGWLAVFAVAGFGAGFLNPVLGAVLFERVPRRMLGRVSALGDSLSWAGMPLGGLIAGAAVASVGLVPVLVAGGAAYFLTTSLAGLRPEWREMDRARARGGGAAVKRDPGKSKDPEGPEGEDDPQGRARAAT